MEKIVEEIFKETLGVQVSSLERLHRMGRKQIDKPRPVIMRFLDHRDKLNVLKNCSKLKGKRNITILEDFSASTRHVRKQLWQSSADERASGSKVQLFYDKIKINGNMYTWDDTKKIRVVYKC